VTTGGEFVCEGCDGREEEGDPDCALCEGEGGFRGSIHDFDVEDELNEFFQEVGWELPTGFTFGEQGNYEFPAKSGIPEGLNLPQ
jgi:hypothetical protein